ncbi:uncharacterized protein LOC109707352 isoform X3 [Ananas comosus]|uniref:Uncharacterized protein LOC109707352 isoform X3 n=1 Tax=Ananas comosus TaxID=4615 RepID=A0A6P5EL39_ANACO|nr:uncharacterized protein LOC109707352 isoform X3 [Ananas comosus]
MASLDSAQISLRCSFSVRLVFSPSNVPLIKKSYAVSVGNVFWLDSPIRFKALNFVGRAGPNQTPVHSLSDDGGGSTDDDRRPPFDLNLAVVLAGFAFEAYISPPENVGWREVDAADCQTVFLSEKFLHEIYDGQLFIKLKKGIDLPAMDPWGTSDPHVVFQLDGQIAKSKIKWATKEPVWNEDFSFNIKLTRAKLLQVAAWDANLVTPHKRMGNAGVNLESLCDGNLHDLAVELEGMGGGGKIHLEIKYRSYDDIKRDKQWWTIPFVSDTLLKSSLGNTFKMVLGSESVNASQFVKSAFGQLNSFTYAYIQKPSSSDIYNTDKSKESENSTNTLAGSEEDRGNESNVLNVSGSENSSLERKCKSPSRSDEYFWKAFTDIVSKNVLQRFGFSLPEIKMWDGFDVLNKLGLQSKQIAEKEYVDFGLATPEIIENSENKNELSSTKKSIPSSLLDIKKVSADVLSQTETILGALMVLTGTLSQQKKNSSTVGEEENKIDASVNEEQVPEYAMNNEDCIATKEQVLDTRKAEEMKQLFSSAESAMEAWAMLATSLGRSSFIKSDFEKICFLDNISTDTQVAIWRDSLQRRLVIAFRGTEQAKWKDLLTDLMLVPTGLNPERLGGGFKQELQVHSGFLNAYDSVRNRIMALIKFSIGYLHGLISVTMYNFGSPRVGNRKFAEVYNAKVKDSWRVVNHRDIIPTVPRLMGYCHVAEPVYLAVHGLKEALMNREVLSDGYQGDVIGEFTPDLLVSEFQQRVKERTIRFFWSSIVLEQLHLEHRYFPLIVTTVILIHRGTKMKGEKQLVEKILQTEINLLRSIRDGTALMQHMEDFYYVALLESVRSKYQTANGANSSEGPSLAA